MAQQRLKPEIFKFLLQKKMHILKLNEYRCHFLFLFRTDLSISVPDDTEPLDSLDIFMQYKEQIEAKVCFFKNN